MALTSHPLISALVEAMSEYRRGFLDLAGLQVQFSAAMSAMEGDIPPTVQSAVRKAEAWLDSIRFTIDDPDRASAVEDVLLKFEQVLEQERFAYRPSAQ